MRWVLQAQAVLALVPTVLGAPLDGWGQGIPEVCQVLAANNWEGMGALLAAHA